MIPSTVVFLVAVFIIWTIMSSASMARKDLKQKASKKLTPFEQDYHARLEALQARVADMEWYEQARIKRRIMELSEKPTPTLAERRELTWMKAEQSDHGTCASSTQLESPYTIWNREQHGVIHSNRPYVSADWTAAEKQSITAIAGTIFHIMTSPLYAQPFRRISYVLVRVNQSCPWMRLQIAHELEESVQDIVHQHLQKQSVIPLGSMISPAPAGARWDPEMNEWYIPETMW